MRLLLFFYYVLSFLFCLSHTIVSVSLLRKALIHFKVLAVMSEEQLPQKMSFTLGPASLSFLLYLKKAQQIQTQHEGCSFSKDMDSPWYLAFVLLFLWALLCLLPLALWCVSCTRLHYFFFNFSNWCSYKWQCQLPAPKTTTVTWRHFPKCTTSSISQLLCLCLLFWTISLSLPAHINKSC